jgi:hypothetical protein
VVFLWGGKQVLIDNKLTEDYTQSPTYMLTEGYFEKELNHVSECMERTPRWIG